MKYALLSLLLVGCCTNPIEIAPTIKKVQIDHTLIEPCVKPQQIQASRIQPDNLLKVRQQDVDNYSDCASRFKKYINATSSLVEAQ